MSSILTNTSAMVALQTLKSINSNLTKVQNEISTGKTVANAKDNAAIWAISKVMESDVTGFKGISDSLSLGSSTLAVARGAAESVTDLLKNMKETIVSAQLESNDRSKLQTEINDAVKQIGLVVGGAQFSGMNLVQGTDQVDVLASLDRSASGNVSVSQIAVSRNDLTTIEGTYGTGTSLNANAVVSNPAANALSNVGRTAAITLTTGAYTATAAATISIAGQDITFAAGELVAANETAAATMIAGRINAMGIEGITATNTAGVLTITSTRAFESAAVSVSGLAGNAAGTQITSLNGTAVTVTSGAIGERAQNITFANGSPANNGDGYRISFAGQTFTYVAGVNQNMEDVAKGLKMAIDAKGISGVTTEVVQNSSGAWQLKVDNNTATTMTLAATGAAGGKASGGLFGLDRINVMSNDSAAAALSNIEHLINRAIDASATFGAAQKRIDIQTDFVGKLSDALTSGIGTLVDADMEEASARLQALQVQQQLGIQALSIANQQPQNLLSLFR